MLKRLCACGCGDQVTRKVESQHLNALAPSILASQVLKKNRKVRRKKKSKAIGFPAPLRQRLARNTTEIDDMDLDDNDPVSLNSSESMMMGEDIDGQSRLCRSGWTALHVEHSMLFQNIISAEFIRIFI